MFVHLRSDCGDLMPLALLFGAKFCVTCGVGVVLGRRRLVFAIRPSFYSARLLAALPVAPFRVPCSLAVATVRVPVSRLCKPSLHVEMHYYRYSRKGTSIVGQLPHTLIRRTQTVMACTRYRKVVYHAHMYIPPVPLLRS